MQGARRTLALHAQPRPLVTDGSALAGDVPTIKAILIVDGEGFWGADRLGMVDHWLESGGW